MVMHAEPYNSLFSIYRKHESCLECMQEVLRNTSLVSLHAPTLDYTQTMPPMHARFAVLLSFSKPERGPRVD